MFIRPHWLENKTSIYASLCKELERLYSDDKVLQQSKQYLHEQFFWEMYE